MRLQSGPLPLYFQLEERLRAEIESGKYTSGALLPTEAELCHRFGVSRITVGRALSRLVDSGVIVRRRGVGTFLAETTDVAKSVTLVGSLDEMLAPARDLRQRVLSRGLVAPPPLVARALAIPEGDRAMSLEALYSSGTGPFSYARLYFRRSVGAAVLESARATDGVPTLEAVEKIVGKRIARAEQAVEPAAADGAIARHFRMRLRDPVLKVVRTYVAEDEIPIEVVIAWYHPKRYRYTIQLFPRPVRKPTGRTATVAVQEATP